MDLVRQKIWKRWKKKISITNCVNGEWIDDKIEPCTNSVDDEEKEVLYSTIQDAPA